MRLTINDIAIANIIVLGSSFCLLQPAQAVRHYTITQRQAVLQKDIAADIKNGNLTLKEANSLKDELADIAANETKMKNANGGKLGIKDEQKLEGELNKVSLKIKKKELKKRTE